MPARRTIAKPPIAAPQRASQLVDEVYRQMFRLEAHRAGAETELALALLRAWLDVSANGEKSGELAWLRQICPICVAMIEDALQPLRAAHPSP